MVYMSYGQQNSFETLVNIVRGTCSVGHIARYAFVRTGYGMPPFELVLCTSVDRAHNVVLIQSNFRAVSSDVIHETRLSHKRTFLLLLERSLRLSLTVSSWV